MSKNLTDDPEMGSDQSTEAQIEQRNVVSNKTKREKKVYITESLSILQEFPYYMV